MIVSQLPSLTALRVLESVSRNGSFVGASSELRMTQSAISYQIRNLESIWDVKLFERERHGVVLTQEGAVVRYLSQQILEEIKSAYRKISLNSNSTVIRICVPPSLAALWLAPRLSGFLSEYPGAEVEMLGSLPDRFRFSEDFDLKLSLQPEAEQDRYFYDGVKDICFPVASPEFLRNQSISLDTATSFFKVPLLERALPNTGALAWESWFEKLKVEPCQFNLNALEKIRYGSASMQIAAAEASKGVALCRGFLVLDKLKSGSLTMVGNDVQTFPTKLCTILKANASPQTKDLAHWIISAARQSAEELTEIIGYD